MMEWVMWCVAPARLEKQVPTADIRQPGFYQIEFRFVAHVDVRNKSAIKLQTDMTRTWELLLQQQENPAQFVRNRHRLCCLWKHSHLAILFVWIPAHGVPRIL